MPLAQSRFDAQERVPICACHCALQSSKVVADGKGNIWEGDIAAPTCMEMLHSSKNRGPCVLQGSEAVLQLLLAQSADPNAASRRGRTLGAASVGGYAGCVKRLLGAGAKVNRKSFDRWATAADHTPLRLAARAGHLQVRPPPQPRLVESCSSLTCTGCVHSTAQCM